MDSDNQSIPKSKVYSYISESLIEADMIKQESFLLDDVHMDCKIEYSCPEDIKCIPTSVSFIKSSEFRKEDEREENYFTHEYQEFLSGNSLESKFEVKFIKSEVERDLKQDSDKYKLFTESSTKGHQELLSECDSDPDSLEHEMFSDVQSVNNSNTFKDSNEIVEEKASVSNSKYSNELLQISKSKAPINATTTSEEDSANKHSSASTLKVLENRYLI